MTITLTGANSLLLFDELRKITTDFVTEHGDLALERIDGEEASFEHMREALDSLPFLANKKMVVLRSAGANKQFAEAGPSLLEQMPETTIAVLVEPKLDKRLAYYKFLKKSSDYREYNELDANALARWAVEAATQRGGRLSNSDARDLIERVGVNQQIVSNEIDKLLLYNATITKQSMDKLTETSPQSTIFELLESAFAGRADKAMRLYAEQRALKVEPQQIVAMLAWQLHVLAIIKAADNRSADAIAKDAKLSPFVVRKSQAVARLLSLDQLRSLVSELLSIDKKSKSTAIDLDEAVQTYLLTLANN